MWTTRFDALSANFLFLFKVRTLNLKFPVEERDTASIVIDHSGPAPDLYDSQVLPGTPLRVT